MSDDITALLISVKCRANSAKHFGADSLYIAVEQVQALIKALEAKQPHHNGMMQLSNELVMAKQRISELERSHKTLRETMAGIHNTIRTDGGYTPLVSILNASKRAYEESAAAAGIQVIEGEQNNG